MGEDRKLAAIELPKAGPDHSGARDRLQNTARNAAGPLLPAMSLSTRRRSPAYPFIARKHRISGIVVTLSRTGHRPGLGTVKEVRDQVKVKWDSGATSYYDVYRPTNARIEFSE
jgi:hypothetical protein